MQVYTVDSFKPFRISADIAEELASAFKHKSEHGIVVKGRPFQLPYGYAEAKREPGELHKMFKELPELELSETPTTPRYFKGVEARGSMYYPGIPVEEFPFTTNSDQEKLPRPLQQIHRKDLQHSYIIFKMVSPNENHLHTPGGFAFAQQVLSNFNEPEGGQSFYPMTLSSQKLGKVKGAMGCSEEAFMTSKAILFVMEQLDLIDVFRKVLKATTAEEIKSLTQGKSMPVSLETIAKWGEASVAVMERAILNKCYSLAFYDALMTGYVGCIHMGVDEPQGFELCPFGDLVYSAGFSKKENPDGTPCPVTEVFLHYIVQIGLNKKRQFDVPGKNILGEILTKMARTFYDPDVKAAWPHDNVVRFIEAVEEKSSFFEVVEEAPHKRSFDEMSSDTSMTDHAEASLLTDEKMGPI